MEIIKNNVVRILKQQARTQKDLAAALGITVQTLQYYYNGNITIRNLERIAAALDVEPWQLIRLDDPGTREPRNPGTQDEPTTAAELETDSHNGRNQSETAKIICPHCGKVLNIYVEKN